MTTPEQIVREWFEEDDDEPMTDEGWAQLKPEAGHILDVATRAYEAGLQSGPKWIRTDTGQRPEFFADCVILIKDADPNSSLLLKRVAFYDDEGQWCVGAHPVSQKRVRYWCSLPELPAAALPPETTT